MTTTITFDDCEYIDNEAHRKISKYSHYVFLGWINSLDKLLQEGLNIISRIWTKLRYYSNKRYKVQ